VSSLLDSFDQAASAVSTASPKKKSLTEAFDAAAKPVTAPAAAPAAAKHWWEPSPQTKEMIDRVQRGEDPGDGSSGIMQAGAHAVTIAVGHLAGLARAGGALLGGANLQEATQELENTRDSLTYTPPAGSAGDTLLQAAGGMKYSPLRLLSNATGYLGDKALDATGSPALATLADVGTNAIATMGAGKFLGSVAKAPQRAPVSVVPRVEPAVASPAIPAPAAPVNLELTPAQPVPIRSAPFPGAEPPTAAPQMRPSEPAPAPEAAPGYLDPGLQMPPAPPPLPAPRLEHASDDLQLAVARAQERGTPINPDVLQRHVEADTLPVPIRLTQGQATLDPATISQEMNSRGGKAPTVAPEFYNAQGKALAQNLDVIRRNAAPDVVADNPTDHGQVLVDQYKAMDAPIVKDIDAKYQALRDANGGEFPVDAPQLLANTKAALKRELLTHDAPPSQMSELEGLAADGKMSFEQFLSLRRNLGNIARTSTDGNARTAASIMVNELEQLPLQGGAADLKPLADAARSAARTRFQAMDADPAYKAAVNDGVPMGESSPLADSFVQKYLINSPRANVYQMRRNLANQPLAQQTIPAATVDFLRGKAKADVDTGQFNAASFNGTVDKLRPKFDALMDPASAATLQQVGNVAKYTTVQPKGSFVNNSNTLVGMGLDVAKNRIGDALNTATLGATGTIAGIAKGISQVKAAKAATAPGAGITKLSDLAPPREDF